MNTYSFTCTGENTYTVTEYSGAVAVGGDFVCMADNISEAHGLLAWSLYSDEPLDVDSTRSLSEIEADICDAIMSAQRNGVTVDGLPIGVITIEALLG